VSAIHFERDETPNWPDWNGSRDWQWHGTMTSTVAAGNGFLSQAFTLGWPMKPRWCSFKCVIPAATSPVPVFTER